MSEQKQGQFNFDAKKFADELYASPPNMVLAKIACMIAAMEARAVVKAVQIMNPTQSQLDSLQEYLKTRYPNGGKK